MPSNPIQTKIRNSFLLGAVIMLVIAVLIGAVLYFLLLSPAKTNKKQENETVAYVYKLKNAVKQGDEIDMSMVESVQVVGTVSQDAFPAKIQNENNITNIPFSGVGMKAKINLQAGTILTQSILYDEELDDTLRYVEYSMLTLPSNIEIGQYIDIRLAIPTGEDYIVLSKVRIENLVDSTNTIGINLNEEAIVTLTSAIVDSYVITASNLYVTAYVDGSQNEINKTYIVSDNVRNYIQTQEISNISQEAIAALNKRWDEGANSVVRGKIDGNRNFYSEKSLENIEAGILEQIEAAKDAREAYLSGMSGE